MAVPAPRQRDWLCKTYAFLRESDRGRQVEQEAFVAIDRVPSQSTDTRWKLYINGLTPGDAIPKIRPVRIATARSQGRELQVAGLLFAVSGIGASPFQ